MSNTFIEELSDYSLLGKDLSLTREFQKFRVDQSDVVLFFVTLFSQTELNREHVYYLIYNAFVISGFVGGDTSKHLSIVQLNDKLDRLYVVNYRGRDFLSIDQSHCNSPELVGNVVSELTDYFANGQISNETSLLAVSAVESVIENFYELRNLKWTVI